MSSPDTALVLSKIVEVHNKLRYVTTVEEAAHILLPALAEATGFQALMLKVRDDDGLFRGYVLTMDGSVAMSSQGTPLRSYKHFMSKATKISNSYYASHEIKVWESLENSSGWEMITADPNWEPGRWHPEDGLLVPVSDQSGDLVGTLWPDCPVDGTIPDESVVQIIEIFATQVVAAIEIRRLLERSRMAAITDGLTRLHTHRHFQECLDREIAEARRHVDTLSLLMLDLDHFKSINDRYGHPTGDQVLRRIAVSLSKTARDTDHVARYGGEEFAVILARTNLAGAHAQAERIRTSLKEEWDPALPRVTVSIGVAEYSHDVQSKESLISAADTALLQAKRTGRDRICLYQRHKNAANG